MKTLPAMRETWVQSLGWKDSPGEGKGNPFHYFGLENYMDCIVHGVTKSQTQLSDFHFTSLEEVPMLHCLGTRKGLNNAPGHWLVISHPHDLAMSPPSHWASSADTHWSWSFGPCANIHHQFSHWLQMRVCHLLQQLFKYFKNIFIYIYLAVASLSCSIQDLLVMVCGINSLTKDQAQAPCIGSTES